MITPLFAPLFALAVLAADASLANAKSEQSYHEYFEETITANSISPDGKHFAYGIREGSDLFLCILELDTGKTDKLKVGQDEPYPNDTDRIVRPAAMQGIYWPTNDRIIYKPNGHRMYSIGLDLKDPVEMLVYRDQPITPAPNSYFSVFRNINNILPGDPDNVLIESRARFGEGGTTGFTNASQYDFYKVNIHTGTAIPQNGAYLTWDKLLVDANGNTRAAIDQKSRHKSSLLVVHPETGKMTPIREVLGDELVDKYRFEFEYGKGLKNFLNSSTILGFGYNPDWLFFASNVDRDKSAIYAINLRTKEINGPILEDENFDVINPRADLNTGALQHSYVTRDLASITTYFEASKTFWINPIMQELKAKVDAKLPSQRTRFTSWSDDLKRVVVSVEGGKQRWVKLLYDVDTDTLSPILAGPEATSLTFPVWIPCAEGHKILCYLTVPKNVKMGAPNKTIALLHGGPWSRDHLGPTDEVRLLADQGYTVLRVNFRGSVGFGKQHTLSAQKRYGDAALSDVVTAIDWCIANKLSQAGDIVAMGGSYGGYIALYASAKRPDLFRRTVAIAPVTDLIKNIKEDRFNSSGEWAAYIFNREMVGDPRKDRELLEAQSPIELTSQYKSPILLVHGLSDYVVTPNHSQSLFKKLKKLSSEHKLLTVSKAGHGGWSPEQIDEIYAAIIDFIE